MWGEAIQNHSAVGFGKGMYSEYFSVWLFFSFSFCMKQILPSAVFNWLEQSDWARHDPLAGGARQDGDGEGGSCCPNPVNKY